MKLKVVMQIVAWIIFSILVLSCIWIGVFFLTASFFASTGSVLPPYLVQIINSLLGILVFASLIMCFAIWVNSRPGAQQKHRAMRLGAFEPIIKAMERIAKGDFKVRLSHDDGAHGFTNELAKSVNQMAQELNQMEHMRQEFISTVSHDIQSPLTCIRGFAQALHNEGLSAETREHYLGIIEMESMRLSRMTDNMLRLVSLDTEHGKIEPGHYRLDRQVRTLILACEPLWMHKTITMDVVLDEVEIFADEDLLAQVWNNLLHNSFKFTPTGGNVRVEVQQLADQVVCRVVDTGIGISSTDQARVFERFYKVDKARERASEGNGLGLAIAKRIVELHQGTISITSQSGAGTTVTVALPV